MLALVLISISNNEHQFDVLPGSLPWPELHNEGHSTQHAVGSTAILPHDIASKWFEDGKFQAVAMTTTGRAGAWHLLGKTLESGWVIKAPVGWDPTSGESRDHYNGTGGNFSVPYIVERNGRQAFLKAIDLTHAMHSVNVIAALQEISATHTFEARILEICAGASMDRVVVAIESGQIATGSNLQDWAPYLIFELAEGDVRRQIQKTSREVRLAWWLRAMHHATIGLSQLHAKGIAHQDLKPSNLLSFEGAEVFKVSDLGRCTCEGEPSPHDLLPFTGDPSYAPPEIVYGYINPQARDRRLRCDLWMLGSMIFFFARGFGALQLLLHELPLANRPLPFGSWMGGYRPVVPLLHNCFTKMLDDLISDLGNSDISRQLVKAASELCNPDDELRGHPLARASAGNPHSLERYISLFDRLAKQAARTPSDRAR